MDSLIAIAIFALLLFLAWFFFIRKGSGVAGSLPTGASPTKAVDTWKTAPAQISVGTPAAFVFESMNNNPLAITSPQLTPIIGRIIGFTTTPGAVQIVSINGTPVGAPIGTGSTTAPNGLVTVIIVANSLPTPAAGGEIPQGALIGIPSTNTTNQVITKFTIVP